MRKFEIKVAENSLRFFLSEYKELKLGEKLVLTMCLSLNCDTIAFSKQDIILKNNAFKPSTSYKILKNLESKGFICSRRNGKYFSPAILEVTEKGYFFQSKLKRTIMKNESKNSDDKSQKPSRNELMAKALKKKITEYTKREFQLK